MTALFKGSYFDILVVIFIISVVASGTKVDTVDGTSVACAYATAVVAFVLAYVEAKKGM